jgi:hypothetical protein
MNSNNDSGGLIVGIIIAIVILIGLAYILDNSSTETIGENNMNSNQMNSDGNTTPENSGDTTITNNSTTTTQSPTDTAFTIKTSDLSSEQKAMLTTAGIDGEEIVITNEMKACAEQSIGVERTAAFADGEKPTVIEAGKLLVCYNQ